MDADRKDILRVIFGIIAGFIIGIALAGLLSSIGASDEHSSLLSGLIWVVLPLASVVIAVTLVANKSWVKY